MEGVMSRRKPESCDEVYPGPPPHIERQGPDARRRHRERWLTAQQDLCEQEALATPAAVLEGAQQIPPKVGATIPVRGRGAVKAGVSRAPTLAAPSWSQQVYSDADALAAGAPGGPPPVLSPLGGAVGGAVVGYVGAAATELAPPLIGALLGGALGWVATRARWG